MRIAVLLAHQATECPQLPLPLEVYRDHSRDKIYHAIYSTGAAISSTHGGVGFQLSVGVGPT